MNDVIVNVVCVWNVVFSDVFGRVWGKLWFIGILVEGSFFEEEFERFRIKFYV